MTAAWKNNGGSAIEALIGGLVVATIDSTGISGLKDLSVTTAKLADQSVTQAKLATAVLPLGVGQTWQDLTGSRSMGVTYTNSTGRSIMVAITTIGTASASSTQMNFYINGVNMARSGTVLGSGGVVSGPNISMVVPNGATYRADNSIQSALSLWTELR